MKTLISFVCIICIVVTGALSGEASATQGMPFTDVRIGDWFFGYVQSVHANGVMQGTSPTTFAPNATFSRAQIIATLFRIHNDRTANTGDHRDNNFHDVTTNVWYAPYVTWASTNGISSGTGATRFGSNDSVTRQEIATIIHNYVRNLTDGDSGSTITTEWNAFADRDQLTSPAAYFAFRWANNNGIVNGTSGTTLSPNGTATRAQAAAMLVRVMEFVNGTTPPQPEMTLNEAVQSGVDHRELLQAFPNEEIQTAFEQEVMRLINNIRREHGLTPFLYHSRLAWLARTRTDEIIQYNCRGGHVSPTTGLSHTDHARAMGVDIAFAGEITVRGGVTPQIAVDTWMNSEPHRRSLLYGGDGRLHIGVGFSHGNTNDFGTAWVLWRSTPPR